MPGAIPVSHISVVEITETMVYTMDWAIQNRGQVSQGRCCICDSEVLVSSTARQVTFGKAAGKAAIEAPVEWKTRRP